MKKEKKSIFCPPPEYIWLTNIEEYGKPEDNHIQEAGIRDFCLFSPYKNKQINWLSK